MNRNPEIEKELDAISPAVANLSLRMPFHIPEGYFELFPARIVQLISSGILPEKEMETNTSFSTKPEIISPFAVPEGYFEELSGNILAKIRGNDSESRDAEIQRISPLLSQIDRKVPFNVPVNYFENLDIKSIVVPAQKETGRIVSLSFRKRWINYAAAAVITAVLAGTVYFYSMVTGNVDQMTAPPVAQINSTEKDSLGVSPEALSSFLAQTDGIMADEMMEMEMIAGQADLAILTINENTITEILQNLPDQAIQEYMSEYPDSQLNTN
jgi:hypothetical protein